MKKIILSIAFIATSFAGLAQVGVGNTDPKATLDVTGNAATATVADGIIAPRLTGDQLAAKDAVYVAAQTGTQVYVTAAATTPAGKTINVTAPGYYYLDNNSVWQKFANGKVKFVDGTNPANAVYTTGNVGIGTTTPDRKFVVSQAGDGTGTFNATTPNLNRFESTANSSSAGLSISAKNATGVDKSVAIGVNPDYLAAGAFGLANAAGANFLLYDFGNSNLVLGDIFGTGKVGIGTFAPAVSFDVNGFATTATSADGIRAPRLSGNQLAAKDAVYTSALNGTMVYVTAAATAPAGKTVNVTAPGYYYFDGSVWQKFVAGTTDKQLGTDNQIIPAATNRNITLGNRTSSKLNIAPAGEEPNISTLNVIGGDNGGGSVSGITVSTNNTDNTTKRGIYKTPQFVNANPPIEVIHQANNATSNSLYIGGNSSFSQASPTNIIFRVDGDTDLANSAQASSRTALQMEGVTGNVYVGNRGTANLGSNSQFTIRHNLPTANTVNADAEVLTLERVFAAGGKWSNNATFNLGSFSADNSAASRLDLRMSRNANLGLQQVMTWLADGRVGIGTTTPGTSLAVVGLPVFADNAAAASLAVGDFYRTADGTVKVKF